ACVVMPTCHNPLGSVMPEAAKKRLVQLLAGRGIPLIEDMVYGDLRFGESAGRAAKSWDRHGNVMLCASFSKLLAPGFCVGWTAPGRWYEQVARLKFVSSAGSPELLQLTIAQYLENGGYERHVRALRRAFGANIERARRDR